MRESPFSGLVHAPAMLGQEHRNEVMSAMSDRGMELGGVDKKQIQQHFNALLADNFKNADPHAERVRDCMNKMFNRM